MEILIMFILISLAFSIYGIIIGLRNFIFNYRKFGNKYA